MKVPNTEFHESLFCRSEVVPCRQMDGQTDRLTYVMKLIVAFHNFVNVPKNTKTGFFLKHALYLQSETFHSILCLCGQSYSHCECQPGIFPAWSELRTGSLSIAVDLEALN
jgi:hypothetical protein